MTEKRYTELTPRGFRIYGEVSNSHQREATARVQESSIAGVGAHCWVFINGRCETHAGRHMNPDLHLDVARARALAQALLAFVADAEQGELTEPATLPPEEDPSS